MGRGQGSEQILFGDGVTPKRESWKIPGSSANKPLAEIEIGPREARLALPFVSSELERGRDEITESLASRLVYCESRAVAILLDETYQQALVRALSRAISPGYSNLHPAGQRERVRLLLSGLFPLRNPEIDAGLGQCESCRLPFSWGRLSGRSVDDGYICSGCGGVLDDD
jgi:hypothetical protein